MSKLSFKSLFQSTITYARTQNVTLSNTQMKNVEPSVPPITPMWFNLQLASINAPDEKLTEVTLNSDYTLVLTAGTKASPFHNDEYQQGIQIPSIINLHIQCTIGSYSFSSEYISLTTEEIQHLYRTYTYHIPERVDSQTLNLQLSFKLPDADALILGSSTLKVPQGYVPIEKPFCDKYYLVSNLPEETAVFVVEPHPTMDNDKTMVIHGRNTYQDLPKATYVTETIANITELMKKNKDDAIGVRGKIGLFSDNLPSSIGQWFTALHQKYQEKFCLIIIDKSKLETPWEMIELEEFSYIGTIALTTRWYPHKKFTNIPLDNHSKVHQGSVIYYLDKESRNIHFEREQQILDNILHVEYSTLEHLEIRLSESLADVGLIYVGCHGQEGRYLQNREKGLQASYLRSMKIHTEARPIAFFNACGSGRVVRGDDYDNSSFVYTMLSHFVQGYIGTLAEVGGQEASELAGRFLQMCSEENQKTIAEILRDFRLRAVEELQQHMNLPRKQREPIEKMFLYTFIYVYYGNPQAQLHLTPRTAVVDSQQHIEEAECNND